ncbi:MAG: hypothetical protein ACTSVV_00520, partial [Promethearchaeota archaeon]
MTSIRKKVFSFLKKAPTISIAELYEAFPEVNKKTLSVYRSQFIKIYNQAIELHFSINGNEQESKFKSIKHFYSILNTFDELPLFLYVKMYQETKELENKGITEYSIVDMCEDFFNSMFTGNFNLDEIHDFVLIADQVLRDIFREMEERNPLLYEHDPSESVKHYLDHSAKLMMGIRCDLDPLIFDEYGRFIMHKKNKTEKKIVQECIQFALVRILNSYIIIPLYLNAPHLRKRPKKLIFRDLRKLDYLNYKGQYVHDKFINPRIYQGKFFKNSFELYNG